jgi:hypothetical protein
MRRWRRSCGLKRGMPSAPHVSVFEPAKIAGTGVRMMEVLRRSATRLAGRAHKPIECV